LFRFTKDAAGGEGDSMAAAVAAVAGVSVVVEAEGGTGVAEVAAVAGLRGVAAAVEGAVVVVA